MIIGGILVHIIDEFKGMKPTEVANYIEGEPQINRVPVEPGMMNHKESGERIAGFNTVWMPARFDIPMEKNND